MSTQPIQPLPPRFGRRSERPLDRASLEDTFVAGRDEIPNGAIVPERWNSRERRLRPRFVAAFVLTAVSALITFAVSLSAAFTSVSGGALIGIGILALMGSIGVVAATWSRDRVSPIPRVLLAGGAGVSFIAVAVWVMTL